MILVVLTPGEFSVGGRRRCRWLIEDADQVLRDSTTGEQIVRNRWYLGSGSGRQSAHSQGDRSNAGN